MESHRQGQELRQEQGLKLGPGQGTEKGMERELGLLGSAYLV